MKQLQQISDRASLLVKRWLAPPVFPADELKTRRAGLLNIVLLVTAVLAFILLGGNLLGGRTPTAILRADLVAIALSLVLRYWARHGQVQWAGVVLISAFLIGITIFSASLGTIRTPTTAFYFLIVAGSGLLFDAAGIVLTTALSSLAILALVWLENAGWLPPPDYTVTITQWITYTALIGVGGALTWSALHFTRQALQHADEASAERTRAEEELQATGHYARSIIESSLDMLITTDNERRIVEFNRAAQETFGYSREEVLGKHVEMLYAQAQESDSTYAAIGKEGKYVGQISNRRKNGEIFPCFLSASTLYGSNGERLGTVGVSRDITERKQAEDARRQAEDKYRIVFETAVEGMFQSTPEGRFLAANPALAQMLGYVSSLDLITNITDIGSQLYVDPRQRSVFLELMNEQDKVQWFDFQVRHKDGAVMWVSANAHAVRDVDGALLFFEGTLEDITGRKRIEEENVRRTAQLEALRQTSLELTAQLDLHALLSAICERAVKLVQATTVSFYLFRPERDLLERVVFHGPALVNSASTRRRGEGLIGKVWETKSPLVANDYQGWTGRNTSYDGAPNRAVVGIPISWGQSFLGVLTVVADPPKVFASEDVELLKLFGDHAAIAIENARLFEETKKRADQFKVLHETAHDLALLQDLPALLQIIVERAVRLLAGSGGGIYLYDATRGDLRVEMATHPSTPVGTRLKLGEGMAGQVALSRQPLIVQDYKSWEHRSPKYAESPLTAVIEVPMLYGGELIGVLVVQEVGETTRTFDDEDSRLLSLFAGQAASAVHNASLLAASHRDAERLTLLNRVARALSTTLKLDDLLEIVYREVTTALAADAFFVALYDSSTTELDFRIRVDAGIREPVQRRLLTPGLTSYVIEKKKPLLIRHFDDEKDQLPTAKTWGTLRLPQSWLGVPVLLGDRLVGVISVQAYRPHAYSLAEEELLSTIADTVALVMENARLFEETARRAEQLATLREIDQTLSSILDLPLMLETTLSRLEQIVPYASAAVLLLDGNLLHATAARGRGKDILGRFALDISSNSIFREMDARRVSVIIDDLRSSPEWAVVPGLEFARSWLGVPLVARGELIGQIGIFGELPDRFTREHADLVLSFANHAAIAIANARLHESTQRNSNRVALLNTIARTVGSTIELDDLLETCLRQLLEVIPADSYYIGLFDPMDGAVDLRIHYDMGVRYPPSRIPANRGLSSLVLKERKPLLIHRLSEEMDLLPIQPIIDGTGRMSESWLGVPMTSGVELIGLLAFASYQPDAFDQEDVALLSSVASQVAIAVDNAQHHAQVEDQSHRDSLTQALNHGYLLKRLDEEIELARINRSTVSLIMLDIDYFKQYNDTYGHVVGDEVLRLMTQAIQMHLKKTDLVGRWGGEEFAIVLPHALTEQARLVAERIGATLAELPLVDREGRSLPKPTVSQGIAAFPVNASHAEKLVDAADQALYVAKQRGRDQIQVAS